MAAPHVTGAVALLKASRPYLTPAEVREALMYLGSTNWTDLDRSGQLPTSAARRLAGSARAATSAVGVGAAAVVGGDGGTARFADHALPLSHPVRADPALDRRRAVRASAGPSTSRRRSGSRRSPRR